MKRLREKEGMKIALSFAFLGASFVAQPVFAYDLFVGTKPGPQRTDISPKPMEAEVKVLPGVADLCEIWTTEPVTGGAAVKLLGEMLEAGEVKQRDFLDVASKIGKAADPKNPDSAAAFLAVKYGIDLVSLKLPDGRDEVKKIYAALVSFAKSKGYRLHDPQTGQDINLQKPGEVPPMWE